MMLIAALVLLALLQEAPEPEFTNGPMLGSITADSALVWARAAAPGPARLELFVAADAPPRVIEVDAEEQHDLCVKWALDGLEAGREYEYTIGSSPESKLGRHRFNTAPPTDEPARVTVAFGSCSDERRFPEQPIWTRVAEAGADAMVLLGDTPYIDSTELERQRRRYREFYALEELAALARRIPFYSTWDDHDFGANDSTGYLPRKERSRRVFVEYHPNPGFGEEQAAVYTSFRRGPLEVFLLDTRWFAATEPSPVDAGKPTLLGAAQWAWLKRELLESTAPFKVLACGMIWNGATRPFKTDHWAHYPYEREALFRFIGEHEIEGVVLVGGDIHRSRALRHDTGKSAGYELIELISSPLANYVIGLANAPHPALLADMGVDQSVLLLTADDTVDPAVLDARFIGVEGETLFELRATADELRKQ